MKQVENYYPNKQLKEKGFVDEYGKQGKWFFYNEDGSIFKEVEYKNNAEDGLFVRYFSNGEVAYKSHFKNGKHEGHGIEYYQNGQPMDEWMYKDGEFFPLNYWDENGNQTLKDGTGYKIERGGVGGGNVDKVYLENGHLVKKERISSVIYLGFTPDDEPK